MSFKKINLRKKTAMYKGTTINNKNNFKVITCKQNCKKWVKIDGPICPSSILKYSQFSSIQSLSRLWLCDPMNRSMPGLPVHHQLPESTQTHANWVSDANQPSHPLSSPPPAPNPSQHQGLFQWVNSSHEAAKVLEFQLQHQSFQWTPRTDLL